MSENNLPMFSSRSFKAPCCIFKSLSHFEFIFVDGVRECSSFTDLHASDQLWGTPVSRLVPWAGGSPIVQLDPSLPRAENLEGSRPACGKHFSITVIVGIHSCAPPHGWHIFHSASLLWCQVGRVGPLLPCHSEVNRGSQDQGLP